MKRARSSKSTRLANGREITTNGWISSMSLVESSPPSLVPNPCGAQTRNTDFQTQFRSHSHPRGNRYPIRDVSSLLTLLNLPLPDVTFVSFAALYTFNHRRNRAGRDASVARTIKNERRGGVWAFKKHKKNESGRVRGERGCRLG